MAATKTAIAIETGRTLFGNMVKNVADGLGKTELVIKRSCNTKLGKTVFAKKFRGYPIYTLTLEERATCPKECEHWADCYGNNMHRAYRYAAGLELEDQIDDELAALQRKHPNGFLVRLHILGDFYSVAYVQKWFSWLKKYSALAIYGYSRRHPGTPIGNALLYVREAYGERFMVRFSGLFDDDKMTALSMDDPRTVAMVEAKTAFICPEQTGKVDTCGDCALCWVAVKPVAFYTH